MRLTPAGAPPTQLVAVNAWTRVPGGGALSTRPITNVLPPPRSSTTRIRLGAARLGTALMTSDKEMLTEPALLRSPLYLTVMK